jgi:hypothetical protein
VQKIYSDHLLAHKEQIMLDIKVAESKKKSALTKDKEAGY